MCVNCYHKSPQITPLKKKKKTSPPNLPEFFHSGFPFTPARPFSWRASRTYTETLPEPFTLNRDEAKHSAQLLLSHPPTTTDGVLPITPSQPWTIVQSNTSQAKKYYVYRDCLHWTAFHVAQYILCIYVDLLGTRCVGSQRSNVDFGSSALLLALSE